MNLNTINNESVFINTFGISDAKHDAYESEGKPVTIVKMISGEVYHLFRDEFNKLFANIEEDESEPEPAPAKDKRAGSKK